MSEGCCGKFRFQIYPKIKVGLLTLQRKRPWPSCPNPKTGNQWSHDMKNEIRSLVVGSWQGNHPAWRPTLSSELSYGQLYSAMHDSILPVDTDLLLQCQQSNKRLFSTVHHRLFQPYSFSGFQLKFCAAKSTQIVVIAQFPCIESS